MAVAGTAAVIIATFVPWSSLFGTQAQDARHVGSVSVSMHCRVGTLARRCEVGDCNALAYRRRCEGCGTLSNSPHRTLEVEVGT